MPERASRPLRHLSGGRGAEDYGALGAAPHPRVLLFVPNSQVVPPSIDGLWLGRHALYIGPARARRSPVFFDFAYASIGLIVAWMVVVTVRTLWRGQKDANAFRKHALSARPPRDIMDMYGDDARFAVLDPHDFCRSWTLLAKVLKVDPRQLRASDRLSAELALPRSLRYFDPAADLCFDLMETCWRNGRKCPSWFDSVGDFVGSATKLRVGSGGELAAGAVVNLPC